MNELKNIKYNRLLQKFNNVFGSCVYDASIFNFICRYKGVILYSYSASAKSLLLYYDVKSDWFDRFNLDKKIMSEMLCENFIEKSGLDLSKIKIYYHSQIAPNTLFKYDKSNKI